MDLVSARGSLYWRRISGHEYLVKEISGFPGKSLGRRSPETESLKVAFENKKVEIKEREQSLKFALDRQQKINRVLGVGQCPPTLVKLCNALDKSGLFNRFMVIGTNAMYGYESLAGIKFQDDLLATLDVDLLWDSRNKIELLDLFKGGPGTESPKGFLDFLRKVDPSYKLDSEVDHRAVNKDGFMVDLVRPRAKSFADEEIDKTPPQADFSAAKIFDMHWLLSAPSLETYCVSSSGRVARMRCVDPRAFALHKNWISGQEDRDPSKKRRDYLQAKSVAELITDLLPQYQDDEEDFAFMPSFPEKVKARARKAGVKFVA